MSNRIEPSNEADFGHGSTPAMNPGYPPDYPQYAPLAQPQQEGVAALPYPPDTSAMEMHPMPAQPPALGK